MKIHMFILTLVCALFLGCSEKSSKQSTSGENDATENFVNAANIPAEQVQNLEQKVRDLEQQNATLLEENNTLTRTNQLQVSKLEELKIALQMASTNTAPDKTNLEQIISQQKDLLTRYSKAISDQKTEILRLRQLAGTKPAAPTGQTQTGLMTRAQFKAAFLGQPSSKILSWSRPDSSQEGGSSTYWYYRNKTYDPITGKKDSSAQVIIKGGRVYTINF